MEPKDIGKLAEFLADIEELCKKMEIEYFEGIITPLTDSGGYYTVCRFEVGRPESPPAERDKFVTDTELFRLIKEKFGIEVKDKNDITAAWLVVEKMEEIDYRLSLRSGLSSCDPPVYIARFGYRGKHAVEDTAPLAIYHAVFLATNWPLNEKLGLRDE